MTENDDTVGGPRVLVGFDGSANAIDALAWAADEAAARGWAMEVLAVMQVPALAYSSPGFLPPTLERFRDEMRPLVEEALVKTGRAGAGHPSARLRVAEGNPAIAVAERAAEADADVRMVVVGARGHGLIAGLMLGSASHALSHTCPRPLVIVPHGWAAAAA